MPRLFSNTMTSTAVLAQVDSVTNWVSAIGTWFGGLATATAVGVALWISHRDRSRADSERRDRDLENVITATQAYSPAVVSSREPSIRDLPRCSQWWTPPPTPRVRCATLTMLNALGTAGRRGEPRRGAGPAWSHRKGPFHCWVR